MTSQIDPEQDRQPGLLFVALVPFLLSILCHLPLAGVAPLTGTEGHRAVTAHQMVQSGEWLLPKLFGRLYLRKPPLHYWVLATVERSVGAGNELIWRIPSVLAAGLTAAVVALMTARWFGRTAGMWAGVGCTMIVALWAQARSADIDSTNTLMATTTALLLIEAMFGKREPGDRGWVWVAAAGLCAGATLLLKGPAGLPTIFGVLVAAVVLGGRGGARFGAVFAAKFWVAMLIGAGCFALYAIPAYRAIVARGLPLDFAGVSEGVENLYPESAARFLAALFVPVTLWVYALPVSPSVVLALLPRFREGLTAERHRIAMAVAWSVFGAWGVCVLSGMVNPRYGNVTLPLLCPVAGLAMARLRAGEPIVGKISYPVAVGVLLVLMATLAIGLAGAVWANGGADALLRNSSAAAAGVAVAVLVMAGVWRSRGAWLGFSTAELRLGAVLLAAGVAFGAQNAQSRAARSGFAASKELREIVGDKELVVMGAILRYQPELFYYSGVRARSLSEAIPTAEQLPDPCWLALNDQELKQWQAAAPERLGAVRTLVSNKSKIHVVWQRGR